MILSEYDKLIEELRAAARRAEALCAVLEKLPPLLNNMRETREQIAASVLQGCSEDVSGKAGTNGEDQGRFDSVSLAEVAVRTGRAAHGGEPCATEPEATSRRVGMVDELERARVRMMTEAYNLADDGNTEGYNALKVMCGDVLAIFSERKPAAAIRAMVVAECAKLARELYFGDGNRLTGRMRDFNDGVAEYESRIRALSSAPSVSEEWVEENTRGKDRRLDAVDAVLATLAALGVEVRK